MSKPYGRGKQINRNTWQDTPSKTCGGHEDGEQYHNFNKTGREIDGCCAGSTPNENQRSQLPLTDGIDQETTEEVSHKAGTANYHAVDVGVGARSQLKVKCINRWWIEHIEQT